MHGRVITKGFSVDQCIERVEVKGLFGQFDYELNFRHDVSSELRPLTLIYGPNGTGKSTILRMMFHALSGDHERGHRSALATMPFDRLRIELAGGDYVTYERSTVKRRRRLLVEMSLGSKKVEDAYIVGAGGRIDLNSVDIGPNSVGELLMELEINPVILTDSRQIASDLLSKDEFDDDRVHETRISWDELVSHRRDEELMDGLTSVQRLFRSKTFEARRRSRDEQAGGDQAYADVVHRIVASPPRPGRPNQRLLPKLRQRVKALARESQGYIGYGLIQPWPAAQLINALESAQDKTGPLLRDILTPYLDGLERSMQSLHPAFETIDAYASAVNSFLEGKSLFYDAGLGEVFFVSDRGHAISVQDLSSGEKQLLTVLSYVTAMREETALLLIDEPEISLNPDWQRMFVPALLNLIEGTGTQLVCATHSIEILAPHETNVIDLGVLDE